MIGKKDIESIERVESLLALLKNEGDSIFKIIGLVQDNPDFFNASISDSCLEKAAETLEVIVYGS
jgi:hypothetical protein